MTINNTSNKKNRLEESRRYWDGLASTFDNEPDHGLNDKSVHKAWTELMRKWIPSSKVTILDIGCGTGSLSVLLAGLGHKVTGIDISPEMVSLAKTKAKTYGYNIIFQVMDAANPKLPIQQYDVIICRHLLWTLPEPKKVLQQWVKLLISKGRLFLIEGCWGTGTGLHAKEIIELLPSSFTNISQQNLSDDPVYWGKEVTDERYAIIADLNQ